jgi:hypothetical protein
MEAWSDGVTECNGYYGLGSSFTLRFPSLNCFAHFIAAQSAMSHTEDELSTHAHGRDGFVWCVVSPLSCSQYRIIRQRHRAGSDALKTSYLFLGAHIPNTVCDGSNSSSAYRRVRNPIRGSCPPTTYFLSWVTAK